MIFEDAVLKPKVIRDWHYELAKHSRASQPRSNTGPAAVLLERAMRYAAIWLERMTRPGPPVQGSEMRDMRDLHVRLGETLRQLAQMRQRGIEFDIPDAYVREAVERLLTQEKDDGERNGPAN